jgi:TonB family protein
MFETLVESGHRRRSPAHAGMAALALHVGIVAFAVQRTAGTPEAVIVRDTIAMTIYEDQPTPTTSTRPVTDDPAVPGPISIPMDGPDPLVIDPVHIDLRLPVTPDSTLRHSILVGARASAIATTQPGGPMGSIDGVLLAGEVDDPVRILTAVNPRYPRALEAAGIRGRVVLQYVVDTTGITEPGSVRVMAATDSAFAAPSREAILATRFAPARVRGHVVRQLVRQTLVFTIRQ